jgi:hypothetical protein
VQVVRGFKVWANNQTITNRLGTLHKWYIMNFYENLTSEKMASTATVSVADIRLANSII